MVSATELINVLKPSLPTADKILPYLRLIDATNRYSNNGPLVTELEKRMAKFFNVSPDCVVAVDNATDALTGSLSTAEQNGEDWYLPSWTFVATSLAAFHSGIRYKFCDIDSSVRANFPVDCKNAIDVLPFGAGSRSYSKYNCLENLVIDGAASLQNLENFAFPEFSTALVVSLHATKMFGSGEGGFVVFNSNVWAERFRLWTKFGMNLSRVPVLAGTNCKMSEYTAAVALASLDEFDDIKSKWSLLNGKAREISSIHSLRVLEPLSPQTPSVYWNLEIPQEGLLNMVVKVLEQRGIETRKWWPIATHSLHFFPKETKSHELYPQSIYRASTTLGLPLHLSMDDFDFERISMALSEVAKYLEA